MPDKPQSQPAPDDASPIPVPGEWECKAIADGIAWFESQLAAFQFPADADVLNRFKVGEIYHLTMTPAWVTVATSDQPKAS